MERIRRISDRRNPSFFKRSQSPMRRNRVLSAPSKYKQDTFKFRGFPVTLLLKKVWAVQLKTSKYVNIAKVDIVSNREINFVTVTRIPGEAPRLHRVRVYSSDPNYPDRLVDCKSVRYECDCADHKYRKEVADSLHYISDIKYSNGNMPLETNPGMVPGICKHAFKALMYIYQHRL